MQEEANLKNEQGQTADTGRNIQRPQELDLFDYDEHHVAWEKYYPYPPPPQQPRLLAALGLKPATQPATGKSPMPPLVPLDTPPTFNASSPALCFQLHAVEGRARAATLHLAQRDREGHLLARPPIPTPRFMPVGTKGTLKGVLPEEIVALQCPIMLSNTYHLAIQPGTDIIHELGGLHQFMGAKHKIDVVSDDSHPSRSVDFSLLTDSGGFQMVSLAKLSVVTEDGVEFENPYSTNRGETTNNNGSSYKSTLADGRNNDKIPIDDDKNKTTPPSVGSNKRPKTSDTLLLRPEDSIKYQQEIGADIIMALDDVVSSVAVDNERFQEATYRTLRWYDRCCQAHGKPITRQENEKSESTSRIKPPTYHWEIQNLFPILQGALDTSVGGLRDQCLAGMRYRDEIVTQRQQEEQRQMQDVQPTTLSSSDPPAVPISGFAIGGVSGGEDKDHFWRVVDVSCRSLPDLRPRYLMGVGYPLDLVVCTALGVDMYDCVYPTRTARFGVALIESGQFLKLKSHACSLDNTNVIDPNCPCPACSRGVTRARLHRLIKKGSSASSSTLGVQLVTHHNIAYMMGLVNDMRQAIIEQRFASFVRTFVQNHFAALPQGESALKEEPQGVPPDTSSATETPSNKHDKSVAKDEDRIKNKNIPQWVKDALESAGISLEESG